MPPNPGASEGAAEWLTRLPPDEWIRRGLAELARAEQRLAEHDRTGGALGLRRAAGMALNGALCKSFRAWGRTYVEHLHAIVTDPQVPPAAQAAARLLNSIETGTAQPLIRLTPPSEVARWVEATKTVMAHAYAVVHGAVGQRP